MNDSLSTGQIAQYCDVTVRTVIRWIENGYLKGYKLPGRGNNRVLKQDFISFLAKQNMPIPAELKKLTKTALIVEDDSQMANAIMRVLRKDDWQCIHAADGFKAGIALAKHTIDLITLDLMMPKMNGFDVLQTLAEDETYRAIPTLVISASSAKELDKALSLGANDILSKPFSNDDLLAKVSALTAHR